MATNAARALDVRAAVGGRVVTGRNRTHAGRRCGCGSFRNLAKIRVPLVLNREECRRLSPTSALQRVQHRGASSIRSTSSSRGPWPVRALADKIAWEVDGADKGDAGGPVVQREDAAVEKVEYNWEQEWYPLYLTAEIPRDAPLALTVFDRPLVVFYDGNGVINCLEDRCPHRGAKLSEGHIMDGRIECLYHGWQFEGNGSCARIPQLTPGAKIPNLACVRTYPLKDSQGVLWAWMGESSTPDEAKLPLFDQYEREDVVDISSIHVLPYDYSILLENVMDAAHVHISHDRTDRMARRENAQALVYDVTERSVRGFAGFSHPISNPTAKTFTRFEAPCVVRNDAQRDAEDGKKNSVHSVMLCRPAGQGVSMLIIRFSFLFSDPKARESFLRTPKWIIHLTGCTVLEQDMGFLAGQSELLNRHNRPLKDLYLNLRSMDTWVEELRRWMDKVGHGLPYYWGHRSFSPAPKSPLEQNAPGGLLPSIAATNPSKGSVGHLYAHDPTSRYLRHIVHCKPCRTALTNFQKGQKVSLVLAAVSAGLATALSKNTAWRLAMVAFALLMCAAYGGSSYAISVMTQNYHRPHKKTP